MHEEMTSTIEFPQVPLRSRVRHNVRNTHGRVLAGVRHPGNWMQLIRFGAVGASGFAVNIIVFAICVHLIGIDFRLASVFAYLVSVMSNFWLNRHWTFSAKADHPARQAIKFFAVSLVAYGFSYVILVSLVDSTGMEKVFAQAIAVLASMPLSFIGQKLWSFKA
jgi:putative flippase GtrA